MMTQLTIKCVIREISTFYSVRARMCMCGHFARICAHAREVGVSSRNLVSRTFPQFYQSMLTAMQTRIAISTFEG